MRNVYLSVVLLFLSATCYCQKTTEDKRLLDSLLKYDPILRMFSMMNKTASYLQLNAGITNKFFSLKNNSLNAMEKDKQIIFTPSLEYFNKSGLGITFTGFFNNVKIKPGLYQYSLTPSYDYCLSKQVAAGVSFTRFFIQNKYSRITSPIQNDLYAYAFLKKPWLKPGIAIGYSTGESNETTFIDTTVRIQNRLIRIQFTDSAKIHLQSFSLIGSVSHTFSGHDILTSNDLIHFTPQLLLNAGSNKYKVTHKSTTDTYFKYRRKKSRIRHFEENTDTSSPKFKVESLALNLNLSYSIGKFDFDPQIYLDYYIPSTTENRLTQVFALNVGYTF